MGLGINQNLAATGILKNLSATESMFKTQVSRLSSGLRINSAADDPAGLVISEKYRAQVDGLGQAIRNAKDGVNLAQTAEGALDEISVALRSMRTLALHAANTGVNDTASIQADQDQITSLQGTINRIVSNTQFGTKKLLDGSAGVTGTTTDANLSFVTGTTDTQTGSYDVTVGTLAKAGVAKGATLTTAKTTANAAGTFAAAAGGTITVTGSMINDSDGGNSVDIAIGTGLSFDTGVEVAAAIQSGLDAAGVTGVTASFAGGKLVLTADKLGNGTTAELNMATASGAAFEAEVGLTNTNSVSASVSSVSGSTVLNSDETFTFNDGAGTISSITVAKGSTISSAVSTLQNGLDAAGIGVTAAFTDASDVVTFTNNAKGSSTTVTNSVSSNLGAGAGGFKVLGAAGGSGQNIAASAGFGAAGTTGLDVAGNIAGVAATGKGEVLTAASTTDANGLQVKYSGSSLPSGTLSVSVTNNSLTMQIGAFANQTASLSIGNMAASQLGITATGTSDFTSSVSVSGIDVTTGIGKGATDALLILDQAISDVTKVRANLGSFQKDTLETTVRNSLVAQQNIRTTESTIRDADIAEETLAFSKAQILQQTGIAMLAQANQAPQQLLALFR